MFVCPKHRGCLGKYWHRTKNVCQHSEHKGKLYFLFFLISYDFSEVQSRKNVCDRIISTMKGAMCRYCNKGLDMTF